MIGVELPDGVCLFGNMHSKARTHHTVCSASLFHRSGTSVRRAMNGVT